jgi:energy-coupling factor transporter ATP-binding protein EcfA2
VISCFAKVIGHGYIISPVPQTEAEHGQLGSSLGELETRVRRLVGAATGGRRLRDAVERFFIELAAARFHLGRREGPRVVAIIGGTGTGKSTLLNRLLGANISASSFRRTYTAGPVAVVGTGSHLPTGWGRMEPQDVAPAELPARGVSDRLLVVRVDHGLLGRVALIDTPDLDGDQPAHHALADRAFRWAEGLVFLVTPEKYQMTELPPYYRLARRYGLGAVFVMNKADDSAVVDDYAAQLRASHGIESPRVFCLARDDAAFDPPPEQALPALRQAIDALADAPRSASGIRTRVVDLFQRLRDQVLHPMLDARAEIDRVAASLRELTTPQPQINVTPVTQQLQRRLQQRSVLYLMGPQRLLDRVRQVPLMLARLPRHTWDLLRHGQLRVGQDGDSLPADDWQKNGPDFKLALVDQFSILQSRIDDLIRSSPAADAWIAADPDGYAAARIAPSDAGQIAEQEVAELREWLTQRWNSTPRDTRVVQALLKVIPGGAKLVGLSEAAPYLLAVVVATHHAFFGPVDLLILGGYSLATWMTEKLSNEVAARARRTSVRMGERYTELAQRQIERTLEWLQRQAPERREVEQVLRQLEAVQDSLG